uniref:Putative regulatory protein FmdB zinc ribbon domain-containing protein n=1 Tax=viral metagenome TaxID=1070528 RepID=A0A6M3LNH6_9ZZZZ
MPLYEYHCGECDVVIQAEFDIDGFPREIECSCGGIAKKIISRTSFNLSPWNESLRGEIDYAMTPQEKSERTVTKNHIPKNLKW